MQEQLSIITSILSLVFIALPLCAIAIGLTRFFLKANEAARSLSMLKEPRSDKKSNRVHVNNVDAARARAQARQQVRLSA